VRKFHEADGQTIWHGDCLDVMRTLDDDSIDVTCTSPPYNMGLVPGGNGRGMYRPGANNKGGKFRDGYDAYSDAMEQDAYDDWQRECLAEMWRISRLGVFYNHRPRVEHGALRMPLSMQFPDGMVLRQIITYDRGTGIDVSLRQFCTRGEWIMVFAKPAFELTSHSASGMGDVWSLGMVTGSGHPAPYPLALPARVISATGATSILDPFLGSGTTLRAAQDAGIVGVGIDNSLPYCSMAAERLQQRSVFSTPFDHEQSAFDLGDPT
jgi:site-specific DNA-methyltransferase (adenine-specific)